MSFLFLCFSYPMNQKGPKAGSLSLLYINFPSLPFKGKRIYHGEPQCFCATLLGYKSISLDLNAVPLYHSDERLSHLQCLCYCFNGLTFFIITALGVLCIIGSSCAFIYKKKLRDIVVSYGHLISTNNKRKKCYRTPLF
jgi:hypothetical protein